MTTIVDGYLPDRPRPPWFATALVALFVTTLVVGLAGAFRAPRETPNAFENRKVEAMPDPPRTAKALREYPARFERYFADRFGMRNALVKLDHWTRAIVFGVSPVSKVLIGKSGWLYFRGEDSKAFDRWYLGTEPVADATIAAIRDELLRRQAFLASRGVAFLVVVVPDKHSIYPEFLPDWAATRATSTPFDRLVAALAGDTQLRVVDLRATLLAAKGADRLYYQTDSHWNYLGAFAAYEALMPEVAKLLPGLTIASIARPQTHAGVSYYSGDLAQMLGLPRQFREDDIVPFKKGRRTPYSRCAQLEASGDAGTETYAYRCVNAPGGTALVYRDSMGLWLIPMLAENFANSTFVVSAQLDPALVESLKPDIVIQEMVERSLAGLATYPMPPPPR